MKRILQLDTNVSSVQFFNNREFIISSLQFLSIIMNCTIIYPDKNKKLLRVSLSGGREETFLLLFIFCLKFHVNIFK